MNSKLEEKIERIKQMSIEELCEKFECRPEEICKGDYIARNTSDTVCPYKVILGFANFENSMVNDLGDLEVVLGKKLADRNGPIRDFNGNAIYLGLNLKRCDVKSLKNLRKVYGSIDLNENITSLGNLKFIGSNLNLLERSSSRTNVIDLGALEVVDGTLYLEGKTISSLQNVKKIRHLNLATRYLKDLGDLEEVKKVSIDYYLCSIDVVSLIENGLKHEKGKYIRLDNAHNY